MKKFSWLIVLLGLLVVFSACQTGGGGTPTSGGGIKIENWPVGQPGQIKFFFPAESTPFSQSNVDANGNTTYSLPTPPSASLTSLTPSVSPGCTGSVNANPSGAKASSILVAAAYVGSSSTPSGVIAISNRAPADDLPRSGDKVGFVIYVDRDANLSGSYNCPASGSSPATSNSFNASLKQGWNYLILTAQAVSGSAVTQSQVTASTNLPPDLKWYYATGFASVNRLSMRFW